MMNVSADRQIIVCLIATGLLLRAFTAKKVKQIFNNFFIFLIDKKYLRICYIGVNSPCNRMINSPSTWLFIANSVLGFITGGNFSNMLKI